MIIIFISFSSFSNRRVRNNLAKNFSDVAATLGIQDEKRFHSEMSLVMACFVALLSDVESEVRASATGHLARMVAWGGPAHFTNHLAPLLPTLADDVIMDVRSRCALALMDAAHGGTLEDSVILHSFGPLLEAFLADEFHEVQLQVLTNLHKIARLLPGLSGVVTLLLQMPKASNWRVREAIAQLLPHLAEARGLDFFASVLLEPAWQVLLMDPVATVRQAIVDGMGLLVRVTGDEWVLNTLLPRTSGLYSQYPHSYLVRITILQTHIEMAVETKSGPVWQEVVVQVLRALVEDKVPNVRVVAAKGLARIVVEGETEYVQGNIRPALEKAVEEDSDHDTQQSCMDALENVK
jgi:serine/threonine-protein phosphatase 2A regulatory subunit A